MTPVEVLDEVKNRAWRGCGGAGFTGTKWETTRNAPGEPKYVIVNADEGDPGAYMNWSVLEGNPHSVLEGLIIGAYAIGSHEGFVYVRQNILAVANLTTALSRPGSWPPRRPHPRLGVQLRRHHPPRRAGAFVSGESSAPMTAIEGRVGEPRLKYIRDRRQRLRGRNRPT